MYKSFVTVQLDSPSSAAASKVSSYLRAATPAAIPAAGPTGGAFLLCNQLHTFTDSNGTYTLQHACGGTTAPWGYKISGGLCAVAISSVAEPGMSWTRNGATQPRQAAHNVACSYQFHGTYNPDHDFDSITYSDSFTFRVDIHGATGTAHLGISGSFYSAACTNPSVCP
jgi:hypothetical protein